MYDPSLGRFHTLDPLAETYDFQTPYAYAANDPIKNIDYNGKNPVIVIAGVVIGVGELALISAGVVTTGYILARQQDGTLGWSSGMQDLFATNRTRDKVALREFKRARKSNKTNKQDNWDDNKWKKWGFATVFLTVSMTTVEWYVDFKKAIDPNAFKPKLEPKPEPKPTTRLNAYFN